MDCEARVWRRETRPARRYRRLAGFGARFAVLLALLWPSGALANWATIVFDPETGAVLQAEQEHALRYPASLTKIMTAYLVLEAVAEERLELSQPLTVSGAAAAQPPTRLGLRKGRTITVEQALKAMILRSANDAAVVLAEAVSRSEPAFAVAMTSKARALGMSRTVFANATGLPDPIQVTTAHDMAVLARAMVRDFPHDFPLFSQTSFAYGNKRYGTTNGWLTGYRGADGMKTGFTCAAGYNLVASAQRDGRRLMAVVLGAKNRGARASKARALMSAGFKIPAKSSPNGSVAHLSDSAPDSSNSERPSQVIPQAQCNETIIASRTLSGGTLPGWGIIFGTFADKQKALSTIKQNRAALGSLARGARPAVIPKGSNGVSRYSALLVGLKKDVTADACKRLWDNGEYCLRLSPEVLNNKAALWR